MSTYHREEDGEVFDVVHCLSDDGLKLWVEVFKGSVRGHVFDDVTKNRVDLSFLGKIVVTD